MGNCKIDLTYERCESQKEVKLDDNDNCLISKLDEDNNKRQINQNNKYKNNYEDKNTNKNNNLGNKKLNLKVYNLAKDKSFSNEDELVIITPRLKNNKYVESNANEVTDEITIKNETLVYINEFISNKGSETKKSTDKKQNKNDLNNNYNNVIKGKKIKNNSNEKKSKSKKDMKINILANSKSKNNIKNNNRKKQNSSNAQYEDKNENHKIIKGKNIPKANNINILNQEYPIKLTNIQYNKNNNDNIQNNILNQVNKSSGNYLNQRKAKSKKNSKVINKSYNYFQRNFGMYPLNDSYQISDLLKGNNNLQSSTLEKQNLELGNILFQNLPLFNSEEIIPNIERKTYKEDLDSPEIEHNIYEENIKNKECLFNNKNRNMKIPIFKKKTDFHIRNKSYNKFNYFNNKDNINDNNYFSLFNNSSNLSINFIHNKFNKSFQNLNPIDPMNNNNIEKHNKSSCNKKVNFNNSMNKIDKKKANPFFDYNKFNKKGNSNKKIKNRSGNLQKSKQGLSNSRSYNNIFQENKNNKNQFNNTNANLNNNLILSSEQNSDIIEVYLPKTQKKSLISNQIMNKTGNKYIFTYDKLDHFNIEQILYDGVIYKVVDNIENSENEYNFLERYFQITKNSFKYYNNINEAIKAKERPLVQFDIRHIQAIELIENSVLGNSKINENKNISILFCIYIKDNNDFFVFAHFNKYVGNNIINILQFLIRYYEDNY